ncbi:MAG: VCBS repeat-containing protein [Anaerolineae bacterium]|nr:VCBS repeat-containing protein [Anaerolineae bacterium]
MTLPQRAMLFSFLLLIACLPVGCAGPAGKPRPISTNHLFRPTHDAVISSPVAYDFDGDGVLEIAVGSWDGYFYLLDAQLNDLPGWPKRSRKGFFPSPALIDLGDDGIPEIVSGSEAGLLYAWDWTGQTLPDFPVDFRYKIWASAAGLPGRRIAIGHRGEMRLLDAQGRHVRGWPQPIDGWPDATAAYADGIIAVTTLTPGDPSKGWVYAWYEDGTILSGFPIELAKDSDSSPVLADLDRDGQLWIVFGDDDGFLHVLDLNGRERAGFPVRTLGPKPGPTPTPHPPGGNIHSIEASPAVGDLDGDGRLEIVAGSWDGRMYVWNDRGQLYPGWPVAVGDQIISSAALVDLDDDNRLDIVAGSKDHLLYGWTAAGEPLPGFPYDLGAHVFSSPWIGDLDGDDRADIVVGANNGIHLLRDVGPLGRALWPQFHHDDQNTGAMP